MPGAAPAAPGLSRHEEPPRAGPARPRAMAGRPCRKGPRRAGPGWAAAPRSPPRCCRCSAALGRPPSPPRPAPRGRAAAGAASAPAAPTACETPVSAALPQPPCPPCRCPAIAAQLCAGKGDAELCPALSSAEASGSGGVLNKYRECFAPPLPQLTLRSSAVCTSLRETGEGGKFFGHPSCEWFEGLISFQLLV